MALAQFAHRDWLIQGKLAGKSVLELGAGTGLLSFACAESANPALRVLATDGDATAVRRLDDSIARIEKSPIQLVQGGGGFTAGVYRWGDALEGTVIGDELENGAIDLVVGADIVSRH